MRVSLTIDTLVAMASDDPDRLGRTSLHYAALDGPVDQVRDLLASGQRNVAATDKQGFTPLHFACQQYRDDVVEVLLDAGAPVDPVDAWGNTPLSRAVFNAKGDPAIVRRLVSAGADPDVANASGRSPRELAGIIGNYDTSGFFDTPA
jgi:ankyrin repeat protein